MGLDDLLRHTSSQGSSPVPFAATIGAPLVLQPLLCALVCTVQAQGGTRAGSHRPTVY